MSETYEDSFKARDRKRQYINRMKTRGTKVKGSLHTFDRLWRRGTRNGTALPAPDSEEHETEVIEEELTNASTSGIDTSGTSQRASIQRRHSQSLSRTSISSERPLSPVHNSQDDDSGLDSTYSGWFGLAGWWHALGRAHRNAVRAQNLERVVINSRRRRQRHPQRYYESPFSSEARALEELEELEREREERARNRENRRSRARGGDDRREGERRARATVPHVRGSGAMWWGPFERWRFRDRTVY
jgi:hypothetical protein